VSDWDGVTLAQASPVHALALTPDERRLLVLTERRSPVKRPSNAVATSVLEIWRAGPAAPERAMVVPGPRDLPGSALAVSPDGRLAAAGYKTVRVWNIATGRVACTLNGHSDQMHRIVFSPDGARIATASDDMTARVWDASRGRELVRIQHAARVESVAFTRDGRQLITGCNSLDARRQPFGGLQRTDLRTRRFVEYELPNGERPRWLGADVSPDGKTLVAAMTGYGAFAIFDVETRRLVQQIARPKKLAWGRRALFSHAGDRVVLQHWDGLSIRDAKSWRETMLIPKAVAVALLADGRLLYRRGARGEVNGKIEMIATPI
jgi:WD40 repeat protein